MNGEWPCVGRTKPEDVDGPPMCGSMWARRTWIPECQSRSVPCIHAQSTTCTLQAPRFEMLTATSPLGVRCIALATPKGRGGVSMSSSACAMHVFETGVDGEAVRKRRMHGEWPPEFAIRRPFSAGALVFAIHDDIAEHKTQFTCTVNPLVSRCESHPCLQRLQDACAWACVRRYRARRLGHGRARNRW